MSHASKTALSRSNSCPGRPCRGAADFGCGWGSGAAWASASRPCPAVIVWGHIQASRTTRIAVESVRSMQTEHEPRAQRASAVVESLVAYDRTVIEYLQSGHSCRSHQHHQRQQFAGRGGTHLFPAPRRSGRDRCQLHRPGAQLLPQLTSHMEHGRDLAKHAAAARRVARATLRRPRSGPTANQLRGRRGTGDQRQPG